ncbi:hypothetical protein [Roseospirillum parvum]|uniref:Uncharacterized protein n=1 Tax=Roseospirillum parvum TaxID=83401 RepID=A0A1G7WKM7_9PROT|nr:hypothetical protein [Roseospirillum parvum]SDG72476.1 hypothetical protein SAMN05421742_102235 [Roseospirillum parvum]
MPAPSPETNALMAEYGWRVHDLQGVVHRLTLLMSTLDMEDFEAFDLTTMIDEITGTAPLSGPGARLAAALDEADRARLADLVGLRARLVHEFFLEFRLTAEPPPLDAARARLAEVKAATEGLAETVGRLYAAAGRAEAS